MNAGNANVTTSDSDGKFIRKLIAPIMRGKCVLLMGPGVAVDVTGRDRTPLTRLLARRLLDDAPELKARCPPEMQDKLRHVAQLYFESQQDLEDLGIVTADFYEGLSGATTPLHRNLARLPFELCINTSPDDYMLAAFRAVGKDPSEAYYSFRKPLDRVVPTPIAAKPLVYHLCGHSEDLYSLVLRESDLIEFLVAVVKGDPPLADYVRYRLGDRDTKFLFVGFEFHNWYLRVLLHVLQVYGHKSRAVALENKSFFTHPEHGPTIGFFSGDRSIEFRQLHWESFAEQLCAAYEASVPSELEESKILLPPDAPKTFLCYAGEDREAVEALGEALEARGIAVWRDKQKLRVGEKWPRVLVDVISKQVDYFVVAQSPQMGRRIETVCRTEIATALDRLARFDPRFLFVLPTTLSPGAGLPELDDLHQIDVSTDEGVDELAKTIREDWVKRERRSVRPSVPG